MTNRQQRNGDMPRKPLQEYEVETNVRCARGSVAVADAALWRGEIVVPIVGGERALITIERDPEGVSPTDATLAVPLDEIDAVVTLLTGLVRQARRVGVLEDGEHRLAGNEASAGGRRAIPSPRKRVMQSGETLKIEHGEQ